MLILPPGVKDLPISPFIDFDPDTSMTDVKGEPMAGWFRYDAPKAERVITFIENFCCHIKGRFSGQPFILTDWQKNKIIRPLYGTMRWDEQLGRWRRQHTLAWYEVARKQGKSALLGALGLYHLCADGEQSAEVYGVAADRDQASLVFDVAKRIVELSPRLRGKVEIIASRKRLVYPPTNSFYQVLPGDAAGALGVNASAVLFDEVLTQRDRHLWDAMRQSFGTRVEPLMLAATTAAYTTADFALQEHEYSLRIQEDRRLEPSRFVFARNLSRDWDYREEGQPPSDEHPDGTGWYYVAPALGDFFSIEQMRDELREAAERPSALQSFRVFRLNQWVSQATRWIDMDTWAANGVDEVLEEQLKGRECFASLDLSNVGDFTAWVLLFPGSPEDPKAEGYTVLPRFFLPRQALLNRVNFRDRLVSWEDAGYVDVSDGPTIDYDRIYEQVGRDSTAFRIKAIGYDPWNATHLVSQIEERGLMCIKIPQTASNLNDGCKALESHLAERQLWHGGNPVLAWMADNVELAIQGDGLMKPSKRTSGEKIDGISALVTALKLTLVPFDEIPDAGYHDFLDTDSTREEAMSDEDKDYVAQFLAAWDADDD